MKKTLRSVIMIMLSISMLVGLFSCCLKESYKEFNIKNITGHLNDDYFTSDKLSFARFENVVIIPEIKAVNHGEYIIYVSAYSQSGKERVQINNVNFKEKESVLLSNKTGGEIEFKKSTGDFYEGWIDGGTFTEDSSKVVDGKEYDLSIEVEIIKNDAHISKIITYEIVAKGYKSFVWPT